MKREQLEPFGLSFLDVISCGFGAVVMLILVFKPQTEAVEIQEQPSSASFELVTKIMALKELKDELTSTLSSQSSMEAAEGMVSKSLEASLEKAQQGMESSKSEIENLKAELAEMTAKIKKVNAAKQAALSQGNSKKLDSEVAGIPVDKNYVIFVVDTSGSMRGIWGEVSQTMNKILEIHPKVKGFQILDADGDYFSEKKWIRDTPSARRQVMNTLSHGWRGSSASDPREGIKRALVDYRNYQNDLSIYVLGDDADSGDFDSVLADVAKLNKGKARINGLAFTSSSEFGTLMREMSQANDGTFIFR